MVFNVWIISSVDKNRLDTAGKVSLKETRLRSEHTENISLQKWAFKGLIPIVIKICAHVISAEAPVLAFARKHWGVVEKTVQIDFSTHLRLARNDTNKRINYSQLVLLFCLFRLRQGRALLCFGFLRFWLILE